MDVNTPKKMGENTKEKKHSSGIGVFGAVCI